ncbi:hypothetical protein KSI01_28220 [Kurthia sibirica]|uniref:DSBA-like thioredoxin domain-containing protein n=1 Tax=Kurthia sibirica TaxID=202750 RepID=A0A2U3AN78_9BACL|nr:hypothetical protein DEX24_05535 [Kurthia sibirica]GEK35289.1 hypothetical protein KSI01_28220 [Kurthia sibirica]
MGGHDKKLREFEGELQRHANEVGLHFDFTKMIPANTQHAHRLAKLMAHYNLEYQFTEALMAGHFIEGQDLADDHYLYDVVESLGVARHEAMSVREKSVYSEQLEQDCYDAQQIGVESAPFFVFDNRFGIIGAESIAVFERTIQQVLQT